MWIKSYLSDVSIAFDDQSAADQDTVDRKNIFPVPTGLTTVWSGLELAKELQACRDESISIETIRMKLCIVTWKHFGIEWLDIFSCIQESRNITPPRGVDDLAVFNLYAYLNICLVPLVWAEIELVYGSDFVLRAGFTSQCSGQAVIASWRFTFLFWHAAFYSFSMG